MDAPPHIAHDPEAASDSPHSSPEFGVFLQALGTSALCTVISQRPSRAPTQVTVDQAQSSTLSTNPLDTSTARLSPPYLTLTLPTSLHTHLLASPPRMPRRPPRSLPRTRARTHARRLHFPAARCASPAHLNHHHLTTLTSQPEPLSRIIMPWPFRKRRRATVSEPAEPAAQVNTPVGLRTEPASLNTSRPTVGRRLSKRRHGPKRMPSKRQQAWEQSDNNYRPATPPPVFRTNIGSVENITALPGSRDLRTSPHLRPAQHNNADIPYQFHDQSMSLTSLPSARDRGKLQKTMSRKKRDTLDTLPRRKSSRKRKDEHVREEEIRAMSAQAPTKRSPAHSPSLLRRDSATERRGYQVRRLDVIVPRPVIRLSLNSQYASGGLGQSMWNTSRPDTSSNHKRRFSPTREVLREKRTIDNLADELDAGGLRELLERDTRRREKKRKEKEDKVRRKLEKEAEKQRRREQSGQEPETPTRTRSRRTEPKKQELGFSGTEPAVPPLPKERQLPQLQTKSEAYKPPQFTAEEPVSGAFNTGTYLNYPPEGHLPAVPWISRSDGLSIEVATPSDVQSFEPEISTAREVRLSQANISPPASPVGHARGPSNISEVADLQPNLIPEDTTPAPVLSPSQTRDSGRSSARRNSDTSGKRMGRWASIFRRNGRRKSGDRGRAPPEEPPFSNTSRESVSRHSLPSHLQQGVPTRKASGTPVRTQSRFREDLPELPLSPPDSRVNSPEVPRTDALAVPASGSDPSRASPDAETSNRSSLDSSAKPRTDSPVTPGGRASNIMAHSLASVDSEASWLSGRPSKRMSQQTRPRNSVGSGVGAGSSNVGKRNEEFSASYEELGIPEDQYFQRLTTRTSPSRAIAGLDAGQVTDHTVPAVTPGEESDNESNDGQITQRPSEEKAVVHGAVARQPTVVHRQPYMKSREGLLKEYNAGSGEEATVEDSATSPTSPTSPTSQDSDLPNVELQRATSVKIGKEHTRSVSAGSAKLLDIPARKGSTKSSSENLPPAIDSPVQPTH
ncbi:hypothetical protein K402DRAFT_407863 [Aulographum hederae CBS 113979]|uniref:Uncharacterized protein n=1 Tax=Aulographum hederae CBS 113979 TaxID=1176131 RepID=A0A6G1GN12_9PEZI|nr:hypothetical protein K402DRAFT_407863 [Aulographum hederae CBS 113979]